MSTAFAKIDTRTPAFQSASSFFETNRKIPAFFFQNYRKFLEFKTPTLGQRKLGENPTPRAVRMCESLGSPGRGREWSGLELTDKLRSNQAHRTKCLWQNVGKVVLKCTSSISITKFKKAMLFIKAFYVIRGI